MHSKSLTAVLSFLILMASPCKLCSEMGPFLVHENPTDSGMFAVFTSVLGALNIYDKGNYAGLKVDLNSGRYLDPEVGPNWWDYYFEPICIGDESYPHYIFTLDDILKVLSITALPPDRKSASYLIQKYVHVKPHIQKEVDAFVKENFEGHFVIGVHHRGTDKVVEWPIVSYEKTCGVLTSIINILPPKDKESLRIYLATDDQHFLSFLKERFPSILIYNDFTRSANGMAVHEYGTGFFSSNYQMGREALLDCLLLSKTNFLIRPMSSCLSHVSGLFNDNLPMMNLKAD